MTDLVDNTLALWRTVPFKWGGSVPHVPGSGDCLLSVGEYMTAVDGQDLASEFRGTYSDEAGAMAHVETAGGAMALIDRHGWGQTREPGRGDVLVINCGGAGPDALAKPVGGLCTGPGVAVRLERGTVEIELRFVSIMKAWKCPL